MSILAILAGISRAQAQSIYLSNLAQPSYGNGLTFSSTTLWQSFITGPNAGGYQLSQVRMRVSQAVAGSGFTVQLAADSGGSPGSTLTTLSGPTPSSASAVTDTYTANNSSLSPSTRYWIGMSASSGNYNWYYPTNTAVVENDGWTYSTRQDGAFPQPHPYFLEVTASSPEQQAGYYFQDFASATNGDTSFGDGSTLTSTLLGSEAEIRDGTIKELQLSEIGVDGMIGAFMLPDLDPSNNVYAFSAKWTGIVDGYYDPSITAGGFSFNFGRLAGLNLIDSNFVPQSGYGEGLSVGFQTYGEPGFHVRAGTNHIAYVYDDAATFWGNNSNKRHFFEVDWHYRDGLTLRIDHATIFANVPTYGFYPQRGSRFVWAAKVGGFNEQVRIDNIVVATRGQLVQETPSGPYYGQPGDAPAASAAFDGNLLTQWTTYAPTGVVGATLPAARSYRVYAMIGGYPDRTADPRDWQFEGSTDGGTNWFALDQRTGFFALDSETRCYVATNIAAFSAARINVKTNNGNFVLTRLAELRTYRFVPIADAPAPVFRDSFGANGFDQVVCSDDGRNVYAISLNSDGMERSDDFGVTWNSSTAPAGAAGIAAAGDGQKVIVIAQVQRVQSSTDSGASFVQLGNSPLGASFPVLAISSNGAVMASAGQSTTISYSTNSGANWASSDAPSSPWKRIAMSGSGQRMYAVSPLAGVHSSTNFGAHWASNNVPLTFNLVDVACSLDGMKAVVAADAVLYVTTNGGTAWSQIVVPGDLRDFESVACNGDGRRMFALDRSSGRVRVFHSTDSGATWTALFDDPGNGWRTLACSGDGLFLYIAHSSGCDTFHLLPKPPYVEASYVTDIGPSTATIVARVRPFGAPTQVAFPYGETTNYGSFVKVSGGSSTGIEYNLASFNLTGLLPNKTYHFIPVATNTTGPYFFIGTNTTFTTSLAPYDAWRYQHFGTTNNSGAAADDADPETDGDKNLLEFASGTDPNATNASPLFRIEVSNGTPRVYFRVDTNAYGIIAWSIEGTPGMMNIWSNRDGSSGEVDSNEPIRTIRFDPAPPISTNESFRLKISYL